MPERPQPPLVIVAPGSPYVAPGKTFGTFTTRFTLILLTTTGTNETMTAALDDMVATVVVALAASAQFDIEEVSTPASFSTAARRRVAWSRLASVSVTEAFSSEIAFSFIAARSWPKALPRSR